MGRDCAESTGFSSSRANKSPPKQPFLFNFRFMTSFRVIICHRKMKNILSIFSMTFILILKILLLRTNADKDIVKFHWIDEKLPVHVSSCLRGNTP